MKIRGPRVLLKTDLRQQVLEARFKLTPDERKARSSEIEKKLFGLPEFRSASAVMFYASFRSEVETHDMIRRALAEGKRVILPRVKGKELVPFQIKDFDNDVVPGVWGIPEPYYGNPVSVQGIDLIVVPGAVFDEQGNRLGYGGGFYDKLLEHYEGATVALAFDFQVVPEVPVAAHDVPLKKIVTEKRVIETNSKSQAPNHK